MKFDPFPIYISSKDRMPTLVIESRYEKYVTANNMSFWRKYTNLTTERLFNSLTPEGPVGPEGVKLFNNLKLLN